MIFLAALAATMLQPGDVDWKAPLFTRPGAIACASREGLMEAAEAKRHSWRYVELAGVRPALDQGTPITPTDIGCHEYRQSFPVPAATDEDFSAVQTEMGWIDRRDIMNDPAATAAKIRAADTPIRPTLCDKHAEHCVYTDVHPFQPVK